MSIMDAKDMGMNSMGMRMTFNIEMAGMTREVVKSPSR